MDLISKSDFILINCQASKETREQMSSAFVIYQQIKVTKFHLNAIYVKTQMAMANWNTVNSFQCDALFLTKHVRPFGNIVEVKETFRISLKSIYFETVLDAGVQTFRSFQIG